MTRTFNKVGLRDDSEFIPFLWNAISLSTAQWVVRDETAEECTDLLFCCPEHGKQEELASFPVSSYHQRVHKPRGQNLCPLKVLLLHCCTSLRGMNHFCIWPDQRAHRSCPSNMHKCSHSQSPVVRQLNIPMKRTQCSSLPYHKKPDTILQIHGSTNTPAYKHNEEQ